MSETQSSEDQQSPPASSTVCHRLAEHFGADPAMFPVVAVEFQAYERVNLQLAINEILGVDGAQHDILVGIVAVEEYYRPRLSKLSSKALAKDFLVGPVEYIRVPSDYDEEISSVRRGVYLFTHRASPMAMLLYEDAMRSQPVICVEMMAESQDLAEHFGRELVRGTRYSKAFRGRVLSLDCDEFRRTRVDFYPVPNIPREEIILPEGLLDRVERHTVRFAERIPKLRSLGRHIKRGILLHGPPGTGKTLLATHLLTRMPGRTSIVITGGGIGSLETAARFARLLEPSTILIEDVDLIGTRREYQTVAANALLFELLNQMDGVAEDCDILFLLTTNQPSVLEPALAARPGRIDQAIEIPLPDAVCRRQLYQLYSKGLDVSEKDLERLIDRTEGASGAFIRELLRKATLIALDRDPDVDRPRVSAADLDDALVELLVHGGALTQSLLGSQIAE